LEVSNVISKILDFGLGATGYMYDKRF